MESVNFVDKTFAIGDTKVHLRRYLAGDCGDGTDRASGIRVVHVHENEREAFEVGKQLVPSSLKCDFYTLMHSENSVGLLKSYPDFAPLVDDEDLQPSSEFVRYVVFVVDGQLYCFDPNRIFSAPGIVGTLVGMNSFYYQLDKDLAQTMKFPDDDRALYDRVLHSNAFEAVSEFAGGLSAEFLPADGDGVCGKGLIVALHNNKGGSYGFRSYQGGGGESNTVAGIRAPDMGKLFWDYNFLLTNNQGIYNQLNSCPFPMVYQDQVAGDGSLLDYATEKGIDYVNIEALSATAAEAKSAPAAPPDDNLFGFGAQSLMLESVFNAVNHDIR